MNNAILGTIVVALLVTAIPAQAGHTEEIVSADYLSGGSAGFNAGTGPLFAGLTWCITQAVDPSFACIGGEIAGSELHADEIATDAATWDSVGYHNAEAVAVDGIFGSSTTFNLCLFSYPDFQEATGIPVCDGSQDIQVSSGCGVGGATASTHDYVPADGDTVGPGFGTLVASVFVFAVYADATTNAVCLASAGSIEITLT